MRQSAPASKDGENAPISTETAPRDVETAADTASRDAETIAETASRDAEMIAETASRGAETIAETAPEVPLDEEAALARVASWSERLSVPKHGKGALGKSTQKVTRRMAAPASPSHPWSNQEGGAESPRGRANGPAALPAPAAGEHATGDPPAEADGNSREQTAGEERAQRRSVHEPLRGPESSQPSDGEAAPGAETEQPEAEPSRGGSGEGEAPAVSALCGLLLHHLEALEMSKREVSAAAAGAAALGEATTGTEGLRAERGADETSSHADKEMGWRTHLASGEANSGSSAAPPAGPVLRILPGKLEATAGAMASELSAMRAALAVLTQGLGTLHHQHNSGPQPRQLVAAAAQTEAVDRTVAAAQTAATVLKEASVQTDGVAQIEATARTDSSVQTETTAQFAVRLAYTDAIAQNEVTACRKVYAENNSSQTKARAQAGSTAPDENRPYVEVWARNQSMGESGSHADDDPGSRRAGSQQLGEEGSPQIAAASPSEEHGGPGERGPHREPGLKGTHLVEAGYPSQPVSVAASACALTAQGSEARQVCWQSSPTNLSPGAPFEASGSEPEMDPGTTVRPHPAPEAPPTPLEDAPFASGPPSFLPQRCQWCQLAGPRQDMVTRRGPEQPSSAAACDAGTMTEHPWDGPSLGPPRWDMSEQLGEGASQTPAEGPTLAVGRGPAAAPQEAAPVVSKGRAATVERATGTPVVEVVERAVEAGRETTERSAGPGPGWEEVKREATERQEQLEEVQRAVEEWQSRCRAVEQAGRAAAEAVETRAAHLEGCLAQEQRRRQDEAERHAKQVTGHRTVEASVTQLPRADRGVDGPGMTGGVGKSSYAQSIKCWTSCCCRIQVEVVT